MLKLPKQLLLKRGFKKPSIILIILIAVVVQVYLLKKITIFNEYLSNTQLNAMIPEITPWSSIGGCGAGGSGGGAGDGIRWTGNGVSGGLIDVELMTRYSFGQNFTTKSVSPRFSFKPGSTTTVGLSVPFMSKTGAVQFRSNQPEETRVTGGLGDISLDVTKSLGAQGNFSLGASISLPTGQYDIKRGSDAAAQILPTSLQKGSGIYNGSLLLDYTKDVEDGLWLCNLTFNFPFAARLSGENEFLDTYLSAYKDSTASRRFYYKFKPYGENDLGGYTPHSASFSLTYAYRGIENFVHSGSILFSAPFGVAWIPSEKAGQYAPRPDPDQKMWSAAFVYGLEFSKPKYPLFVAFSLPLHDKSNKAGSDEFNARQFGKWDAPDFKDFLQQGTIAFGIKSTMF
jgi:hypothetical protein